MMYLMYKCSFYTTTHRSVVVQLPHIGRQGGPPPVFILTILPCSVQTLQVGNSSSSRM
jgi:hypothetical protein